MNPGWILGREFDPGEKIPSENGLVEKFQENRLTGRQAIFQKGQDRPRGL
jgi:DNA-binding GntR family transcriptional regulator